MYGEYAADEGYELNGSLGVTVDVSECCGTAEC